jgi:hypothetical protein
MRGRANLATTIADWRRWWDEQGSAHRRAAQGTAVAIDRGYSGQARRSTTTEMIQFGPLGDQRARGCRAAAGDALQQIQPLPYFWWK